MIINCLPFNLLKFLRKLIPLLHVKLFFSLLFVFLFNFKCKYFVGRQCDSNKCLQIYSPKIPSSLGFNRVSTEQLSCPPSLQQNY